MASKQSRRSFSMSGFLAERLQEYAESQGQCVTEIVEREMRKFLNLEPNPRSIRKPVKRQTPVVVHYPEVHEPAVTEVKREQVSFAPRPVQPTFNNSKNVNETAAERRARILREASERQVASGWQPPVASKPVNKAKKFSPISRMGKRPSIPVAVSSTFFVDGDEGMVEEVGEFEA